MSVTPRRSSRNSTAGSSSRGHQLADLSSDLTMTPASSGGDSTGFNEIMNSPLTYGDTDLRSPTSNSRRYRPDINSSTDQRRQMSSTQGGETPANTSMAPIPESDAEDPNVDEDAGAAGALFIWGTNISVAQTRRDFRYFLEHFGEADADETLMEDADSSVDEITQHLPLYMRKLREISQLQSAYLNIDLKHVKAKNERLYRQIITYPAEILPYLDMAATSVLNSHFPEDAVQEDVVVRPFNAHKIRNMRDLDPQDIDQLITVSGMVIRASSLIPEPQKGFFECSICKFGVEVDVHRGRIEEPMLCTHCNTNHSFVMIHNRSIFTDKQLLKVQEAPEEMPSGQTPHTVSVYVYMDLVDSVQPGDRVTVTGLFRAAPIRINPRMRTVKSIYRTHIDAVHFLKKDDSRLHAAEDGSVLSSDRVEKIIRMSKRQDIYDRLAHAVAPNIFEHEDIKKGILCLLFGGTKKDFTIAGRPPCRSEINMLLCGDPGTSKSQLLQYVHELVPRSQYTSGKGSSAVGLTAYLTKDPDTKQLVLQTGALVLSDNGVCCIDEFDKMNESTRSVLHEVMEQQTMSIAKAGIISQLNARASILAAANPVDSQWNPNKTIIENVQLPHTLLSRFDLIFLMLDPQLEAYDRRLAQHLVSLYYQMPQTNDDGQDINDINISLFRDYIQYAKAECQPRLTEDACENLMGKYAEMRRIGRARGNISAFPRQLESLIRLSEAHAKIRLSKTVVNSDVDEAYRLHREALKQSAVDPVTGLVDPGMLASGTSTAIRRQVKELGNVIRDKLEQLPTGIHVKQLFNDMRKTADQLIRKELFDDAIAELIREEAISRDSHGRVKVLFRAQRTGGEDADPDSMAMG